jgi:hypothetical protein
VDDEILTIQGSFPSNASLSSALGFIAITQIFPHQGECIARQRRYRHRMSIGEPYSPLEVQVEKEWIERSKDELARKMESLPRALRDPDWVEDGSEERRAVLGMQRANILVTEASVQFTLVCLSWSPARPIVPIRPMLTPSQLSYADDLETNPEKAAEERTRIGRTSFAILSSLPLDDLAANGESMVSHFSPCDGARSMASTLDEDILTDSSSAVRSSGSCWTCSVGTTRPNG